ncbi:MAG: hypothetical protein C0434_02160 [Xanthomonadaceae bacterium]|nr:hypothetical protein [Xanthomonadaceae bacterium]
MNERSVLFVPQHQGGGTGEFYRLLAVAEALQARDASVHIRFLMPQACPLRARLPFACIESDLPDDQRARFHAREIARLEPPIVVFDKTCRGALLRHCRRHRAHAICISDEPGTLAKALRVDWLWQLPEHWHQRYLLDRPAFSRAQRFKAALGRTRHLLFDVCHAEAAADDSAASTTTPYVLFVPGGGGYALDGRPVPAVFAVAADAVARASGARVLIIGGERPFVDSPLDLLPPQPQAALMRLVQRATLVVTGGGHLLHQAMSLGVPTVTLPLGGSDQGERIGRYADCGWTLAVAPEPAAIAPATLALLGDEGRRRQMRERLAVLGLRNGLPLMVAALLARLDRAG